MRILITNDDGITAPGLEVIEAIAADLAGPDGEVWVVAPAFEQSGVSHCISYIRPMMLQKMGERRYAVEGTPADEAGLVAGDVVVAWNDTPIRAQHDIHQLISTARPGDEVELLVSRRGVESPTFITLVS